MRDHFTSSESGPCTIRTSEPFVTERAVAEFLKVSIRTLQRWRTEPPTGGGPRFYKLGAKRIAYRLSDLSDWAQARAFNSTSEVDAAKGA